MRRRTEFWTVNHRGCGLGRGLAKGTYHCGVAGDLGAVFAEARRRGKGSVLAIGFSLSGNALLLNLGEGHDGPHPKPDCAIAVNPPVNLGRCSMLLGSVVNRPYDYYFVQSVLSSVRDREEAGLIPKGRYLLDKLMTLRMTTSPGTCRPTNISPSLALRLPPVLTALHYDWCLAFSPHWRSLNENWFRSVPRSASRQLVRADDMVAASTR